MRIEKITIKNYRSFDQEGIEIELPDIKIPFSIVGHNNSGKSNLLSGLAMCLGIKHYPRNGFSKNDFHMADTDKEILIEAKAIESMKSSDAFNKVKEMPIFQLKVSEEEGEFETKHYFCDASGKPIYNPRAVKRTQKREQEISGDDLAILSAAQKQGAEQVWKWESKIPVSFIDTASIQEQLRINRYTVLGKVLKKVRKDFESENNKLEDKKGVPKQHVGTPRKEIFEKAMNYLTDYVISTKSLEKIIASIEDVLKKQLQIESQDFSLKFGFPSADTFFDNMIFYLTDNPSKPKLPIDQMGDGVVSLFVVALFRAILDSDQGGHIFLIEEPETFLHEHFQEYFYNVLCELAQNNQVIYTTHSKKFVNIFEPKTIIRLNNPEYLRTQVAYDKDITIEFPSELDGFVIENPKDFPKYMRTLEPNLGNIIFATKVIIVEGPHDLLAYKSILSEEVNLELNNIAIVSAWGKDPIVAIVRLCKKFKIPYFVIHDWDLTRNDVDVSRKPDESNPDYRSLIPTEKAQYTKNHKILKEVGALENIHYNKKNLEVVLKIPESEKSATSVFGKLKGKNLDIIMKEFPNLIDDNLLRFVEIKRQKAQGT
ncbi:MAG: AAA family ATPase [Sedimentisphaerales bacterium]